MTRWARVTTSFEGFHRYPDAPEAVAFLRDLHRHMFHVTAWIQQFHDNRDVEYVLFLRWLKAECLNLKLPETASCEYIANFIRRRILEEFPGRKVRIQVMEDAENGALVEENETSSDAPIIPAISSWAETDRAYLAALLDGEGGITVQQHNISYPRAFVGITICNEPILLWLSATFGNKVTKVKDSERDKWQWGISGLPCKPLLLAAQPYLRLKRLSCELALALIELGERYKDRSTRTTQDILIGQKIADRLRELTIKGATSQYQGRI